MAPTNNPEDLLSPAGRNSRKLRVASFVVFLVVTAIYGGQLGAMFARRDETTFLAATAWLAIAIILCSMFLPFWFLVALGVAEIAWLLCVPLLFENVPPLTVLVQLVPITSVLAILVMHSRNRAREQHEHEEARRALARIEKMGLLGEMAASLAREINNPLAIIEGYATRILRLKKVDRLTDDALQPLVEGIRGTIHRIAAIVQSLRALTHEASPSEPMAVRTLDEILSDVKALTEVRFRLANVRLMQEGEEGASVLCHPTLLSQVLVRIIMDIVHAVQGMRDAEVRIGWQVDGKLARLHIEHPGGKIAFESKIVGLILERQHVQLFYDPYQTKAVLILTIPRP